MNVYRALVFEGEKKTKEIFLNEAKSFLFCFNLPKELP
jgi:hypothetical protein